MRRKICLSHATGDLQTGHEGTSRGQTFWTAYDMLDLPCVPIWACLKVRVCTQNCHLISFNGEHDGTQWDFEGASYAPYPWPTTGIPSTEPAKKPDLVDHLPQRHQLICHLRDQLESTRVKVWSIQMVLNDINWPFALESLPYFQINFATGCVSSAGGGHQRRSMLLGGDILWGISRGTPRKMWLNGSGHE